MIVLTSSELKQKTKGEVNDELRQLFASQYDLKEHRKLREKEEHKLDERELSHRYEIIFKHFQDYCSKGEDSMMQRKFGPQPGINHPKRELWNKKSEELALFMIRVYSGVEDKEKLKTEIANWIVNTENELNSLS